MSSLKFLADVKSAKRIGSDIKNYITVTERATQSAVKKETASLKDALRGDVRSAGLGNRLANTWRSKAYPEGGKVSANAVGWVWSKAPDIIEAYDRGVTIKGKEGFWLAIPTKNVPKGRRGKRLTPDNWPNERLGRLRFVYRSASLCFLVVDEVRASYSKTGALRGYRKASKSILAGKLRDRRHAAKTKIMFILKPMVKVRKVLNVKKYAEAAVGKLPGSMFNEKQKLLR